MILHILGMNGPFPAPGGATSGYLVTSGATRVAMDLGAGCLARLTALTAPETLDALLLSHWHFDHTSDVLPLLYRLESHAASSGAPLHIYAPADESSPVRQAVANCKAVTLHTVQPGDAFTLGSLTVLCGNARHPVPALMFRLTDGIRTLVYTGDTNTLPGLAEFATGADLLLADGLFTNALWSEGKPHLSAALAAQLAQDAHAGKLVITHLNPAIDPAALLSEARAVRPDALFARCGDRHEV